MRLPCLLMAGLTALISAAGPCGAETDPPPPLASVQPADGQGAWRILPLRSRAEYEANFVGGDALQHLHGLARSASHPDIIYLSHDCGQFWRSRDNGLTWRKCLCKGCWLHAGQSIEVDPVDPNIVVAVLESAYNYLAADREGLYRSVDGGDHWELVLPTQSSQQRFYQHLIAWDPASRTARGAQRWYAAFPNNALFRSEDGGATWRKTLDLKGHAPLYAVQTHPADGRTLYLASARGLLVSRDRGERLEPLGNLPAGEVTAVAIHPTEPNTVFAVIRGGGLYESRDAGRTFSLRKAFPAQWVFLNGGHPRVIYLLGTGGDSLVSHDAGATWTPVQATGPLGWNLPWQTRIGGEFSAVLGDPRDANAAVGYSRARLWRTADGGRNWTDSSTLFCGYAWGWGGNSVAFDREDPNHFAFFCYDAGMVATDSGGRWFQRRSVPGSWHGRGRISWTGAYVGMYQPLAGSRTVLATVGYYHDTKLMRSADDGLTWELVDEDTGNHYFLAYHPADANLAFSQDKRSQDGGATWQAIPELRRQRAAVMGIAPSRPDTLYALAPGNRILRSDDRGQSWRQYVRAEWRFSGLSSKPTFAVDPRDANVVYTLSGDRDLASFDGAQWRAMGILKLAGGRELGNFVEAVAFDPRRPGVLYAATAASGLPYVFRSLDGGRSWQDITQNLPRLGRGGLAVNPHTGDVMHGSVFGTWVFPPPYDSPRALYHRCVPHPAK